MTLIINRSRDPRTCAQFADDIGYKCTRTTLWPALAALAALLGSADSSGAGYGPCCSSIKHSGVSMWVFLQDQVRRPQAQGTCLRLRLRSRTGLAGPFPLDTRAGLDFVWSNRAFSPPHRVLPLYVSGPAGSRAPVHAALLCDEPGQRPTVPAPCGRSCS